MRGHISAARADSLALEAGDITYAQTRAMTRVATVANEEVLLEQAQEVSASQLEVICRRYRDRTSKEGAAGERQREQDRDVRRSVMDSGLTKVEMLLRPEEAALLWKAMEAMQTEALSGESTRPVRLVDAVAMVARRCLDGGAARAGTAGAAAHEVVVHVDADALTGDDTGRAELEDGTPLAAATARRLACDASIVTVVEDGDSTPLAVGRRRTPPAALRRALALRDPGCRFPGCPNRRFVDAHHVQHWADGGATELSNLTVLCTLHHRAVHEGGFTIVAVGGGRFEVRAPDGRLVEAAPRLPFADERPGAVPSAPPLPSRVDASAATATAIAFADRLDVAVRALVRADPVGPDAPG